NDTVRLVAYAEGCAPGDEVGNWWPIHNAIARGNDFSETISLEIIRRALGVAEGQIVIVAGEESYYVLSDTEYDCPPDMLEIQD
ncbi:MAG: hypothetical protein ACJ8AW_33720, partial [Rhodopila sp.]